MGKIEQLAGLCRITLQRMENNSDMVSALFQADQVFVLHGCASLNDLLRPFSLSEDRGLLRRVAGSGAEVSGPQVIGKGLAKISPVHQPLYQEELNRTAVQPKVLLSQRQTAPVLPVGYDSSPQSQLIVQSLFDGIRQELELGQEQGGRRSHPLPFNPVQVAEEKNGLQSAKKTTGGSQKHSFTADHGNSRVSPAPSAVAPESERTGWFDRHPRHKAAARGLLPKGSEQFISENTLKKWAAPLQMDERLKEINTVQQEKKMSGAAAAPPRRSSRKAEEQSLRNTATVSKKISSLHADGSDSRIADTLLTPASGSASSSTQQEAPASQLEQLMRKWQGGPRPIRRERDRSAEEQTFSDTLERILKREIRRHGIEEEP